MRATLILVLTGLMLAPALARAQDDSMPALHLECNDDNDKIEITLIMSTGSDKQTLSLDKNLKGTQLKNGKAMGCDAMKYASPKTWDIPQENVKDLKAAQISRFSIPRTEKGKDFNLTRDILLLQKKDGTWSFGPMILAGNQKVNYAHDVMLASPTEVKVNETSGPEDEPIVKSLKFTFKKNAWVPSK